MISGMINGEIKILSRAKHYIAINEMPFYCKVEGVFAADYSGLENLRFRDGEFIANFKISNMHSPRLTNTRVVADGMEGQGDTRNILNFNNGDSIKKAFPDYFVDIIGSVGNLEKDLVKIAPLTFRERLLYFSQHLKVLANCYGNRIRIMEKPGASIMSLKGHRITRGGQFEYEPPEELKFFFKKNKYKATELFGQRHWDIALFDQCKFGTVLKITREYKGLDEKWRGIFVDIEDDFSSKSISV